jgi:glycosyltransferase involved in cell wall biosynthesis
MKKKLLFVVHSLGVGGTERLVVSIAQRLTAEYSVGIVCLDSRGALWEECLQSGIELFCVERTPGSSLGNFGRFNSIVAAFRPDIVHAHQYTPFFFAAVRKISSLMKFRLIFTEHGRNFPDVISSKRKFANKYLLKQADAFTGVSQFTIKSLRDVEGVSEDIELIYNGVNAQRFLEEPRKSIRRELSIPDNKHIVAVVGSLREVKNPMFVLRAFELVKKTLDEVVLVYLGEGPLRDSLYTYAVEHGLESEVFFAGVRVPATPYFHQFSTLVLASHQEAASLAILEAMHLKVPVIVSDRGGSPELVGNNDTGLVVECDNDRELGSAIIQVLSDESWAKQITEAAQVEVSTRFSFDNMLNSYQRLYEKLT